MNNFSPNDQTEFAKVQSGLEVSVIFQRVFLVNLDWNSSRDQPLSINIAVKTWRWSCSRYLSELRRR